MPGLRSRGRCSFVWQIFLTLQAPQRRPDRLLEKLFDARAHQDGEPGPDPAPGPCGSGTGYGRRSGLGRRNLTAAAGCLRGAAVRDPRGWRRCRSGRTQGRDLGDGQAGLGLEAAEQRADVVASPAGRLDRPTCLGEGDEPDHAGRRHHRVRVQHQLRAAAFDTTPGTIPEIARRTAPAKIRPKPLGEFRGEHSQEIAHPCTADHLGHLIQHGVVDRRRRSRRLRAAAGPAVVRREQRIRAERLAQKAGLPVRCTEVPARTARGPDISQIATAMTTTRSSPASTIRQAPRGDTRFGHPVGRSVVAHDAVAGAAAPRAPSRAAARATAALAGSQSSGSERATGSA